MLGKNKPYIYELKYTSTAGNYNSDHLSLSDIKAIEMVRDIKNVRPAIMGIFEEARLYSAEILSWKLIAIKSGLNEAMLEYIDERISNCQCL